MYKLKSLLTLALLMSAVGDETAAGGAAPETPAEARQRQAASNFLPIVRGRLPLIYVHAVRYDKVLNAMGNKDLASKLSTSVGKVFDVKKGSNFAYVNADWKPTQEDVAAAEAHIAQIGAENAKGLPATGDKALLQSVLDQYKERGLANAEEAAAFTAARGATRVRTPRAAAPVVEGQAATETPQTASAGAADSLLA